MKFLLSLVVAVSFLLPYSAHSQQNVLIEPGSYNAIFVSLHSESSSDFIAAEKIITVPDGKIWKIMNSKVAMTYDNRLISDKTFLYLDEQIIALTQNTSKYPSEPLWLPEGSYRLTIRTEERNHRDGRFGFGGFITGIEFNTK